MYSVKSTCAYPSRRSRDFGMRGMVLFVIFKRSVLTILHYSQIADGKMEKRGELPAAEAEIEPRCPGLVWKLPGLSRRAMRRLQCRGILMGRANHLSSPMPCEAPELCPSVCQQSPEEAGCSGGFAVRVPGCGCAVCSQGAGR